MRLVDGEERRAGARQEVFEAIAGGALGGHVAEIEVARCEPVLHRLPLPTAQAGVEDGGPHAELLQRVHLVLHQRNEGRNDDPGPAPHHRRNLVAERLAAARRHQHQRIVPSN